MAGTVKSRERAVRQPPMEAYFRNLLRSVLREAVRRGIVREDQTVKELIKD